MNKHLLIIILLFIIPICVYADFAKITVNFTQSLGSYPDSLFGVTGGLSGVPPDITGYNLSSIARFTFMGFIVDDFGPANPNNPGSYDFTSMDTHINLMIARGVTPVIQLFVTNTPANLSNYTTYVANIARHLTQGWNNGFFYPVLYYRFGNEPNLPQFWMASTADYFHTYRAVALALKSVDSTFIITAPALVSGSAVNQVGVVQPYVTNFLNFCRDSGAPLDIFTIHGYGAVIYNKFYRDFNIIDSTLSNYSTVSPLYGKPKLGCDEWNLRLGDIYAGNVYHPDFDTIWAGAQNICAWMDMTHAGISESVRYGGTFNGPDTTHDFPLVHYPTDTPKPSYYAFQAANSLQGSERIFANGSDFRNLTVLAGKFNQDTVCIVISHYDTYTYLTTYHPDTTTVPWDDYRLTLNQQGLSSYPTYTGATILLRNLPWTDTTYQILCDHYLVNETTNFVKLTTLNFSANSSLLITNSISPASIQLLVFYPQSILIPVELSAFEAVPSRKDE